MDDEFGDAEADETEDTDEVDKDELDGSLFI